MSALPSSPCNLHHLLYTLTNQILDRGLKVSHLTPLISYRLQGIADIIPHSPAGYREAEERAGDVGATHVEAEPTGGVWTGHGLQLAPTRHAHPPGTHQAALTQVPSVSRQWGASL